jgi:hypothetical protein
MSGREAHRKQILIDAERDLLRRICQTGIAATSADGLKILAGHPWADPDHRVIFEALVRLAGVPTASLRDRLPAEATRMGFPDIAWDKFLTSPQTSPSSRRTTGELIDDLLSASNNE